MLRLKQAIGAYIVVTTLLPIVVGCQHYFGTAHAATYYVATNGNNANDGLSEATPKQTVVHCVSIMLAGDTCLVRGGTYNETAIIRFNRSGTQAAPIKLLNYPGETPVIDFNGSTTNMILIQHSSGVNVAMGWITIQGFEIREGWVGIKYQSMHNSEIRNNWIHDNTTQGILGGGGHHNLIDRNIINHNGNFAACAQFGTKEACTLEHGIYAHGDSYTITNNLIYDNLGYGIQQNGSSSSAYSATKHPGPEFAGAANWIIANNTFAYENHRSGIVLWGALCGNARLENNIFYENSQFDATSVSGISFTASMTATGIQIRNNHAYATAPGPTAFLGTGPTEGVHYTQSGNVVNVSPPGFVNGPATLPASPNFALTARSPAIDAGLALAWTKIDLKGTARPQGPASDIGAYEYRADGDAQSPVAPVELRVN
jgi:hypothetical protein